MPALTPELLVAAAPRVWAQVERRGPDECWPWTGTRTKKGYAQLMVNYKTLRAHRVVFAIEHGHDPGPNQICHRCDNPPCCNPRHLFEGTAAVNQADKKDKGRAARGEANKGGGKLTAKDVRRIRTALRRGATKTALGQRFGVSRTEIGYIASGKHWSHVQ